MIAGVCLDLHDSRATVIKRRGGITKFPQPQLFFLYFFAFYIYFRGHDIWGHDHPKPPFDTPLHNSVGYK